MATVRILRSTTAGNVPSSLVSGQIAINEGDGKLFYRNGAGVVTQISDPRWDLFLPAAPTGLTVTGGNGQASLSWTAPTGVIAQAPIQDYTVQFKPSGGVFQTFTRAASTAATATVTGLDNGTAYVFRVAAVNGIGTGAYTSESSGVTPSAPAPVTLHAPYGAVTGSGTVGSKWVWQSGSGFSDGASAKLLTAGASITLQATLTNTGGANCDGGEARSLGIYSAANARIRTMSSNPESLTAGQYIMMELDCAHARAQVWVV